MKLQPSLVPVGVFYTHITVCQLATLNGFSFDSLKTVTTFNDQDKSSVCIGLIAIAISHFKDLTTNLLSVLISWDTIFSAI
jgi:hypothetical protein